MCVWVSVEDTVSCPIPTAQREQRAVTQQETRVALSFNGFASVGTNWTAGAEYEWLQIN